VGSEMCIRDRFSSCIDKCSQGYLVFFIVLAELVRISGDEFSRHFLDRGYPNFSHASTSEKTADPLLDF